jgi:two-component system, response regulator YesN
MKKSLFRGGVRVNVVLVDDEQWIVAGLARILSKQYPGIKLKSFTNPQEALDDIVTDMPDLLITDIRMPEMGGLELIERVRALGLRFYAVLTGLDDFMLVKQSMWLQVSDYLIKPLNKTELFRLVDHVEERLREYDQRAQVELPGILRLCASYGTVNEPLRTLALAYRTALVVCFGGMEATLPSALQDRFGIRVELWNLDQSCWLFLSTEQDMGNLQPILRKDADILGFELAAFDPDYLHEQFTHVMSEGEGKQSSAVKSFCSTPPRDEEAAEYLLNQMAREKHPPLILDKFAEAVGLRLPFWHAVELAGDCLSGKTSREELAKSLRSLPAVTAPHSADVLLTIQWVSAHFEGTVTLARAAANVFLQANYFTTLFRKEMNVSFIQYLNELRVDKACRYIMMNPDATFEEVAQQNGFASVRHFFSTFRKYTGQTPGEYRRLTLPTDSVH